uniref:Uncharacterized protein n=1 Tax=Romanomermis culicivorax TaxID=13658 RepID=A0A915JTC8_ROMCU
MTFFLQFLITKPQSDQENSWMDFLRDRLFNSLQLTSGNLTGRCNGVCLADLAVELRNLKEDLANRSLDNHSRTPTIMADVHSDSSSMQSTSGLGRRQSELRRTSSDVRRMSFSSKVSRLSPSPVGKPGSSPQESIQSPIDECTIMEEAENEQATSGGALEQTTVGNGGAVEAGAQVSSSEKERASTPGLLSTTGSSLMRRRTTLRMQRGVIRKQRQSFYKTRETAAGDVAPGQPSDYIEMASLSRARTSATVADAAKVGHTSLYKTQSLDYPPYRMKSPSPVSVTVTPIITMTGPSTSSSAASEMVYMGPETTRSYATVKKTIGSTESTTAASTAGERPLYLIEKLTVSSTAESDLNLSSQASSSYSDKIKLI